MKLAFRIAQLTLGTVLVTTGVVIVVGEFYLSLFGNSVG